MNRLFALPIGAVLSGTSYSYKIQKVLGQGTFGITYLATVEMTGSLGTLNTGITVAIKEFFMCDVNGRNGMTVTAGGDCSIFYNYKRRFIKEAETLSRLKHPNIVKVMDFFEVNNTAYYVMEYLEGGNLDNLISQKDGLSLGKCDKIIRQIGAALQYMHSKNMLHLDLKPLNVMLNSKGDAVLIDFGLSKQFDANGIPETSTSIGHGTPGYAPLEQVNYKKEQGFQATIDVYALGATLYKMITGVRPPAPWEIIDFGLPLDKLKEKKCNDKIISFLEDAMAPSCLKRIQTVTDFLDRLPLINELKELTELDLDYIVDYDTISVFILLKNNTVVFYHHGNVFKNSDDKFWLSLDKLPSISSFVQIFSSSFGEHSIIKFEDFVKEYIGPNIKLVVMSYDALDDYFRIMHNDIRCKLIRENSAISAYLSTFDTEEEDEERVNIISYGKRIFSYSYGEGVCEVGMDADNIDELRSNGISVGKKYHINKSENLMHAVIGGMVKVAQVLQGQRRDFLLIDKFPFDIHFGPKWGEVIPKNLERGIAIPTRKGNNYDFVGTDLVGIKIGNKTYVFDLTKKFKCIPKEIECIVEIDHLQNIKFIIKDAISKEEIALNLKDLEWYCQSDNTIYN